MKWFGLVLFIGLVALLEASQLQCINGHVNASDALIEVQMFDEKEFINMITVPVLVNGDFEITLPSTGSYMVSVSSKTLVLQPSRFRIDAQGKELSIWELQFGDAFSLISDLNKVDTSIQIHSIRLKNYIQSRRKAIWDSGVVLYLREHPIMLLIAIGMVLFLLFPVVLGYIDPELAKSLDPN